MFWISYDQHKISDPLPQPAAHGHRQGGMAIEQALGHGSQCCAKRTPDQADHEGRVVPEELDESIM